MHQRPISFPKLRKVPKPCSWVAQRLVRDDHSAQLRHEACPLSLFLVTVADAEGLSCYSERSLCQRLSMTRTVWRQARQARIPRAFVAYHSPRSQVLALGGDPRGPAPALAPLSADDEPVDLKAVCTHIWEVLS